jgi:thiamine pyrophosphokinase
MKGILFLNGEPPEKERLNKIQSDCFIIAADGAYNYLHGIICPDILIGDFDSLSVASVSAKKIIKLAVEKDYTDGHMAVLEMQKAGVSEFDIYGGFGGRYDQQLANYSLLALAKSLGMNAVMKGKSVDVYFASSCFSRKVPLLSVVSLVPFIGEVHILQTRGLKYQIKDETYHKLHIKGISNIAISEEICFDISSGSALIFIEKGEKL